MFDLAPLRIDVLAEIAIATYERHRNKGQFEIGRRTHHVARQHPEASRISWNVAAQRNLHGEVCGARLADELFEIGELVRHLASGATIQGAARSNASTAHP